MVKRWAGGPETVGSSPATPTLKLANSTYPLLHLTIASFPLRMYFAGSVLRKPSAHFVRIW